MSREIKFRAWSDSKKIMYEPKVIDLFIDFMGNVFTFDEAELTVIKELKLMQYTGLKDKIGKDIYENDILKVTHEDGNSENFHVEYLGHQNYPAFDLVPFLDCDCNGLSHVMAVCKVEVIGNKYENPELLEVKE